MADAAEIWAYIAADNPSAADRLLNYFDRIFLKLSAQPNMGKGAGKIAPNLRVISTGSYVVFYRTTKDGIEVARIIHSARDITAEFFRD